MKKILIVNFILILLLTSCSQKYHFSESNFFAMDTFVYLKAENANTNQMKLVQNEIYNLEKLFSRTNSESEVYLLNKNHSAFLSNDTKVVLEKSLQLAADTEEAFSPALGILTELWDVTSENPHVPSDENIKDSLLHCDYNSIKIEKNYATLTDDKTVVDLGGIVKGYVAEIAMKKLNEQGIENAMISLGGNIAVIGSSDKNRSKNIVGWNVGIKDPKSSNDIKGFVTITNAVCAVSGDYERFFIENGEIYHHIFDKRNGMPAKSGLSSVAVISSDGALADALTTAFFVMGKEKSLEFYKNSNYDFEAIFIDTDNFVTVTNNLKFTENK